MSLRVALIRQRYTPFGGAERFVDRALSALAQQGAKLTLITRQWSGDPPCATQRCDPFYIGRRWRDAGFAHCVSTHLRDHHYDLVQSHERIAGCDIYRAGDGVHRAWLEHRRRILSRWQQLADDLSPYHRYVLDAEERMFRDPRLRTIICNSKLVQRELQRFYDVPATQTQVIYSGVDTERFHPRLRTSARSTLRPQLGIADDDVVFLFVGSGYERKGVRTLLHALARVPRGRAVIVGKDKQERHYQRLAQQLGIDQRCHFLGAQKDVAPYYGAADILVLPTLYDPFPNVILEAMACGLPIITSDTCGGADFIVPGQNGYVVDALDDDALSVAMDHMCDGAKRRDMGLAARHAVESYTLENMGQQVMALYQQLLRHA